MVVMRWRGNSLGGCCVLVEAQVFCACVAVCVYTERHRMFLLPLWLRIARSLLVSVSPGHAVDSRVSYAESARVSSFFKSIRRNDLIGIGMKAELPSRNLLYGTCCDTVIRVCT